MEHVWTKEVRGWVCSECDLCWYRDAKCITFDEGPLKHISGLCMGRAKRNTIKSKLKTAGNCINRIVLAKHAMFDFGEANEFSVKLFLEDQPGANFHDQVKSYRSAFQIWSQIIVIADGLAAAKELLALVENW